MPVLGTKRGTNPEVQEQEETPVQEVSEGSLEKKKQKKDVEVKTEHLVTKSGENSHEEAAGVVVHINRAPVLTLWVAVVAERQGYSREEALTFGRYIAGILAHSKGKSLGIYQDTEITEEERERREQRDRNMGVERVMAFGMSIPTLKKGKNRLAFSQGSSIIPTPVQKYLDHSFQDNYEEVKDAMSELAHVIPKEDLERSVYKLYEKFRPDWRGWGIKGELNTAEIRRLGRSEAWKQYI